MIASIQDNEWLLQPPRRRSRAALGWSAAVLSLGAHWFAASELPPMPLGAPLSMAAPERMQTLEIESVFPEPPPPLTDRPPEFRADRPDESFARIAPREFMTALDPTLLQPASPSPELSGDHAPVQPAEVPPPRIEWQPRRERVEITRQIVREPSIVPPRRLSPGIDRTPMASDLIAPSPPPSAAAPVSLDAASAPGTAWAAAARIDAVPEPPMPRPEPPPALRGEGGDGSAPVAGKKDQPVKLREAAAVLEERGPDVTGMKPIEHLLRLDLHGFTPPDQPGWFYFSLQIHRASEEILPVLPRDVFIAHDCSASMTSAKVQASRRGLQAILRELPAADRFDIMSFRDRIERCFGEWTGVTPTARARAAWFVEQMDARGMTDVFAALDALKGIPRDPNRPLIAVMISDGRPTVGLQDNMEIIHQFSRANAGAVSVFAFSGGSGVNRFLLDFLSYKNRGDSSIVRDTAGFTEGMESLFREISRPVLMELEYRFSGLESAEIYPGMLTHLFLDRPLVLHGRVPTGTPATAVRITGRSGPATHDMVFPVEFASAAPGDAGLRDGWARQKLTWLIGQFIETRDPAFRDEAAALARSLGPTMPYAAELGVPDAPVRR